MNYNILVGTNCATKLENGNFNFIIGENSGIGIIDGNCNFIFGNSISGENKDNQFIIGDVLPTLDDKCLRGFWSCYPKIYYTLVTYYSTKFSEEQINIMKERLEDLFIYSKNKLCETGTCSILSEKEFRL